MKRLIQALSGFILAHLTFLMKSIILLFIMHLFKAFTILIFSCTNLYWTKSFASSVWSQIAPQFQKRICCQLEVYISKKIGIQIYLLVVLNLVFVCTFLSFEFFLVVSNKKNIMFLNFSSFVIYVDLLIWRYKNILLSMWNIFEDCYCCNQQAYM